MASSSTARSCAAVISPRAFRSRASRRRFGRRKLPTWSARNGGRVRVVMGLLVRAAEGEADGGHHRELALPLANARICSHSAAAENRRHSPPDEKDLSMHRRLALRTAVTALFAATAWTG